MGDLSPFEQALRRQDAAGLLRVEQVLEKPSAREIRLVDGRLCTDFSSNSYLGLHAALRRRAGLRFLREGHQTSAGSSRMVSGTRDLHRRLESSLADFVGAESAAVFGSGFLCCASVLSTLAGARDLILFDEKCHASLRAGIAQSGAESLAYRHASISDLEQKLAAARPHGSVFIVTDGLFSMDGDFAPLPQIVAAAEKRGAYLVLDDAHAVGSIGPGGRGTFEKFGLRPGRDHILIGTLSKTLASYGGFVAASDAVIRYIKARSKEFIYTTGAPPFQIITALEALKVVRSAEGGRRRAKLQKNISTLARALERTIESPIVSIPVAGGPRAVLSAALGLRAAGCFAVGMRYPTVPRGQEMIRVSLSSDHTPRDIRRLAAALRGLKRARNRPMELDRMCAI